MFPDPDGPDYITAGAGAGDVVRGRRGDDALLGQDGNAFPEEAAIANASLRAIHRQATPTGALTPCCIAVWRIRDYHTGKSRTVLSRVHVSCVCSKAEQWAECIAVRPTQGQKRGEQLATTNGGGTHA